jgi:hypothetical protein
MRARYADPLLNAGAPVETDLKDLSQPPANGVFWRFFDQGSLPTGSSLFTRTIAVRNVV